MKKFLLAFIAALSLLVFPASALAASNTTEVGGTVSYQGKHVGKGVIVSVTCNGKTKTDTTNKKGQYDVTFSKKKCGTGSTVTVTVNYMGNVGTSTGKVDKHGHCSRNVGVKIPVSVVPEFGPMATIAATLSAGAAFFVIRRRHLSGHNA